jgi:hypothetical protein
MLTIQYYKYFPQVGLLVYGQLAHLTYKTHVFDVTHACEMKENKDSSLFKYGD